MTVVGSICKTCLLKYNGNFFVDEDIRFSYEDICDLCGVESWLYNIIDISNLEEVMNNYKTDVRSKEIDKLLD